MKVILTTDVPRIGKKYDIKDVPQGFAHNFLLKNNKAVVATPEAIREIEAKREAVRITTQMNKDKLRGELTKLKEITARVSAPANEQGHLFKSIHEKDIVEALKANNNVSITEKMIALDAPIKTTGMHTIPVSLEGERGEFTLVVEAA